MNALTRAWSWWGDRWPDVLMGAYYAGIVVVGLIGFRDPSISVTRAIGTGYLIYAVGLTSFGIAAIRSTVRGARRSEAVCLVMIALLTVLHGLMLAVAGANGIQSGVRLMISLPGAIVLAYLRSEVVYLRRDLRRYLRVAEEARAAEESWKRSRDA